MSSGNKYHRKIRGLKVHGQQNQTVTVDVYSVLTAFGVTSPGVQHAVKKLLCSGLRDKGSRLQDLKESIDAITRAIEDEEVTTTSEPLSIPPEKIYTKEEMESIKDMMLHSDSISGHWFFKRDRDEPMEAKCWKCGMSRKQFVETAYPHCARKHETDKAGRDHS